MKGRRVAVRLVLPKLLVDVVGARQLRLEARTVREALEEAYREVPALRFHLCDESGDLRTHVLVFHNGTSTRELGSLDVPLCKGDEIAIVQAISGG